MQETPFAYRAIRNHDDHHLGTWQTLAEAIHAARSSRISPDDITVYAVFPGNREVEVEPDRYSRANPPSREEALTFVRQRAQDLATGKKWAELRGLFRCNPHDPEEKQVADYIRTAPRIWAEEETRWAQRQQ